MAYYTYYTRLTLIHPKDIGKMDPSVGKIIAETATTGKFIIGDITWDSAVASNPMTTLAMNTQGEMKIYEPLGMRFLDYIRFAALECGIENHLSAAYLLEIEILAESMPDNKEFRYIWPIMFLSTEARTGEKGTEYAIKFVHHSHHSQTDMVQPLKETLTIDGVSKVEEYFKEFGKRLELMEFKYAEAGQKAGSGGQPGGDHPAASSPYHDEYHFILDPRIKDYTFTSKDNADPGVKGSWTNYLPFTTNRFNVSARSGTTLISQAQRVLSSTNEAANLYLEEYGRVPGAGKSGSQSSGNNKDALKKALGKIYNFFKIESHTVYKEFDYIRGRYAVKHIFIIWLALQPNLYQYPDELDELNKPENKSKVEQKLKAYIQEGLLRKAYYYTYTGLNTEIIKCNLTLNQAYYLPSFPVIWTERGSTGPGKMKPYNFSREISPYARTASDAENGKEIAEAQAAARKLSQQAQNEKNESKKKELVRQQKEKEKLVEELKAKKSASGTTTSTNKNQLTNRSDLLKSLSNLYIEDVDYQSGLQASAQATPSLRPRVEPDTPVSKLDSKKDENENLMDKIFTVQLAARDLLELEMEVRGDPYWLGQPNMCLAGLPNLDKLDLPPALKGELESKIPEIDPDFSNRNSSWGNYGNGAKFYKGGNLFYFNAQLPVNDFGQDDLMKFDQIDQILGIYMVQTCKNEFKNGQWTQVLKCVRDLTIPSKFIPRASIGETTFQDYVNEATSDPNRALDSFNQNRSDKVDERNQQAASQGFANTGGGAATGNPIIAQGTQPGNPNTRPGSLRDRATQANVARAAAAKEKLDNGLKTNPAPDCDSPVDNASQSTKGPGNNAMSVGTFEVTTPLSKQQAYAEAKQQFYNQVTAFFKHLETLNIQAYKDAGVVDYVPYKGETLAGLVIQRSGSGGLEDWKKNNTKPGPWSINNPGGLGYDSSTGTYPSYKSFYEGLLAVNSYYNYCQGVPANGSQGADRFLLPIDSTMNELEYIQMKSKGFKS